jgi:hypothetical protein
MLKSRGDKYFIVAPNETFISAIIFSPLSVIHRLSKIGFFNSESCEFVSVLGITAEKSDACAMAQMLAATGKFASTMIVTENPIDLNARVTIKTTTQTACRWFLIKRIPIKISQPINYHMIPATVHEVLKEIVMMSINSDASEPPPFECL